jgi:hypothetical protein
LKLLDLLLLLLLMHLLDDAHGAGLARLLLRGVDEVTDLDLGHDWRWLLLWLLGSFGFGDDDARASFLLYKAKGSRKKCETYLWIRRDAW